MKHITSKALDSLSISELTIYFLFIKRKFKVNFQNKLPTEFKPPLIYKNKRNEEMIKFVLKSYIKYLTVKKNGCSLTNFFKAKKALQ